MIDETDKDFTITLDSSTVDPYGITDSMLGPLNNTILNSTYPINNTGSLQYTSPYIFTTNNTGPAITTNPLTSPAFEVNGDANFEGDLKIKGKSILTTLETIEKRLAILQPDPKKLEKYEALRKAYEHYKTLEALIGNED